MRTTGGRPRDPTQHEQILGGVRPRIGRGPTDDTGLLSRSAWILLDQGLSSLFSLVVGFAAARGLTAEQFGLYAALFTGFLLSRGFLRAVALDPIAIRFPGDGATAAARFAVAVSVAIGALGCLVVLLAALMFDSLSLVGAAAASVAVVLLLLVDCFRVLDVIAGRPQLAALTSSILLLGGMLTLLCAWLTPVTLNVQILLVALTAAMALGVRAPTMVTPPSWPELTGWVRHQKDLAAPLILDFAANLGIVYVAVYLLAFINLTEAGELRAAQMVAAPLFMLYVGIIQVVMTEGSRIQDHSADPVVRLAKRALLLATIVSGGYVVAIWLGRNILTTALGATGQGSATTLVAMAILAALTAPAAVVNGLLRAIQQPGRIARARAASAGPILLATVVGALSDGARGVILYGIAAQVVTLPLWWLAAKRGRQSALASEPPPADKDHDDDHALVLTEPPKDVLPTTMSADDLGRNRILEDGRDLDLGNDNGASEHPAMPGDSNLLYSSTESIPPASHPASPSSLPAQAEPETWLLTTERNRPHSRPDTTWPGDSTDTLQQHRSAESVPLEPMAHGVTILTHTGAKPVGVPLGFIARVLAQYSWLILLFAIGGALVSGQLRSEPEDRPAVASIPMALENVDWSDLEATHQANRFWVATELPALLGTEPGAVVYRLPDSLQLTAFSIESTAAADAEANRLVAEAATQLVSSRAELLNSDRQGELAAVDERIETASSRLGVILSKLEAARTEQIELIEDEAEPAVIAVLTGEVWSLETERNAWEQELFSAETERSRLGATPATGGSAVVQVGEPRVEQSSEAGESRLTWIAGALVGLWIGAVVAYLVEYQWGSIRDGRHPQLARLGIRICDLGERSLDHGASLALYDSIVERGVQTSVIDTSASAGGATLVAALNYEGLDTDLVKYVPVDDDGRQVVGTVAVLVAGRSSRNIRQVLRWCRRAQELDVPVDRLVLTSRHTIRDLEARLDSLAGHQ